MTLTRLLAATCSILALAGCGTSESSAPAGGTPPADAAGGPKPATEATRPASDEVLQSPPLSDKADVKDAEPAPVVTSGQKAYAIWRCTIYCWSHTQEDS